MIQHRPGDLILRHALITVPLSQDMDGALSMTDDPLGR
jgi:hypothetical protein